MSRDEIAPTYRIPAAGSRSVRFGRSGPQGLEPCPPDQKDSGAVRCANQELCRSGVSENRKVLSSVSRAAAGRERRFSCCNESPQYLPYQPESESSCESEPRASHLRKPAEFPTRAAPSDE